MHDEVDVPQLTPAEMAALVDETHRLRKKVADQAAKDAIDAGVDSIEHGSYPHGMNAKEFKLMVDLGHLSHRRERRHP